MEQNNSKKDKKNNKKPKVMLFLFIIPILLLILLTGITIIGVYLLEQDTSGATSQLIAFLTPLIVIIVVVILLMRHYYSIRYLQFPLWRWIAGGFKGKPDVPHIGLAIRKSKDAKHYKEMSRIGRICMLSGFVCQLSGIVILIIGISWFLVLDLTHKGIVGSIALTLFCVGALLYILGAFINYICTGKDTKRGDSVVSE
jgi:drug/metabolite transporter (DMT)-like permease